MRVPVWLLALLALLLWGGEYIRRGLWEPDEARYAYVAREMRSGNHWLVPHLHGVPYPDKPPLPFWLANAAALPVGGRIDGVTARVPTFVGALAVLWTTARLLEHWSGRAAAWRGIGILFTTYLFWHEGGWGRLDMLLLGAQSIGWYHLFRYNSDGERWRPPAAYGALAAAILIKGPVGLVVPLLVYIAGSCASGEAARLRRGHWLWGVPLAVLPALLWLASAWRAGAPPDYFSAMFGTKSFGRILRDHHAQPVYYYLTTMPLDLLPWTLFLPAALRAPSHGLQRRRLVMWIAVVIGLFSLFVGKRNTYVLAAVPAVAMLIAVQWPQLAGLPLRWQQWTARVATGFVGLLGPIELVAAMLPGLPLGRGPLLVSAAVMLAGTVTLVRLNARDRLGNVWLLTFCSVFFLHAAVVGAAVLPSLNARKTPLEASTAARTLLPPGAPVYLFREQLAIVPLYAGRAGKQLESVEELETLLRNDDPVFVVFHEDAWAALEPHLLHRMEPHPFQMGSKDLVWAVSRSVGPGSGNTTHPNVKP